MAAGADDLLATHVDAPKRRDKLTAVSVIPLIMTMLMQKPAPMLMELLPGEH